MAATTDVSMFKGKFIFTRDTTTEPTNSSCMKVGPKVLKMLEKYKCFPFEDKSPPLMEAIGKCEKSSEIRAYIFKSKKNCEEALSDVNGGDAT